LIQKKKT